MSSKEFYKSWYIKGIAESVIKEIREDREDGEGSMDEDDEGHLENVLDYYLRDTYWSIYSRKPKDAVIVVELVKQYIEEMESAS